MLVKFVFHIEFQLYNCKMTAVFSWVLHLIKLKFKGEFHFFVWIVFV